MLSSGYVRYVSGECPVRRLDPPKEVRYMAQSAACVAGPVLYDSPVLYERPALRLLRVCEAAEEYEASGPVSGPEPGSVPASGSRRT